MPNPDLTRYVDLRFYDADPQTIINVAQSHVTARFPNFAWREGTLEAALLEAWAIATAELQFTINRLPAATAAVLFRMYGLDPDVGAPPTTTIRVTVSDSVGHEIPAGLKVRLGGLLVTTTSALVIAGGLNSGVVAAIGAANTARLNGTPTNTRVELLDSIAFVEQVETASVVSGGRDPEGDVEWRNRAVQGLRRLRNVLVLASDYTAATLERPEIGRAVTLDNFNGDLGTGSPGSHPGHVTEIALGADGTTLTTTQRAALKADLLAQSVANLDVHVIDPTITAVNVTATVRKLPGFTVGEVLANLDAALRGLLNPAAWPWSTVVRRNDLIALIENTAGVDYLQAGHPTTPTADVTIGGIAALATAGTLTLTVSNP